MKKRSPTDPNQGFEFLKLNTDDRDWRDIYYFLLTLSWPQFTVFLFGSYVVLNTVFALFYCLGDGVDGMEAGSFPQAFFFSVETLATVGYGHMYPATVYGHVIATAEIMVGMFGTAVMTGLIFVRFSRPTARIMFSRTMALGTFDGQPALMVRAANLRHHAMVEAEFRMMLLRNEVTREDPSFRRFYPLKLMVERAITFPAVTTMRHLIDEQSPLYGVTPESLERTDARLVVSVVAVDSIMQAPLQAQQDYSWREVHFGRQFVEVYQETGDGQLTVDYGLLHETEPLPLAG